MKKILLTALFSAIVAVGTINAQTQEEAVLEPTKLGKWTRPANTKVAEVETYLDACQAFYQEAIDIRKQYESIDTVAVNATTVSEETSKENDALQRKRDEYKAVIDRIETQKDPAAKLVDLAAAAVQKIPLGLKALAVTKAINSGKDCAKLAIEENTNLLKAATKQITSLSGVPVKQE